MPAFITGSVLLILCVSFAVIYFRKTGKEISFETRGLNIAIFVISLISLVISIKLFWNMGVYADEYGSSPALVCGGWFWLLYGLAQVGFAPYSLSGFRIPTMLKRSD